MKIANRILCPIFAISVFSCGQVPRTCWDTVAEEATSVSPTQGVYSAESTSTAPEANTDTDQNPAYPLSHWGFSVTPPDATDPDQDLFVRFSTDGYRYDNIRILAGVFTYIHGDTVDGTVCPTDGYSISGHFTTTTAASGHFEYIPDCCCRNGTDFLAQYQPDYVPTP